MRLKCVSLFLFAYQITTVGYLSGKNQDTNVLKDSAMLKRLSEITAFPEYDREHILYVLTF